MAIAHAAYIVQSWVGGLGHRPFHVSGSYRPDFRDIFASQSAFEDMRKSIPRDLGALPLVYQLPPKPFIKGLGNICFLARSARISYYRPLDDVATALTNRDRYWDPEAPRDERATLEWDEADRYFGVDRALKDQRMNHLYFEPRRPRTFRAKHDGVLQATGKVFVHVFPSGYVVVHLAIALSTNHLGDLNMLHSEVDPKN